MDSIRLLPRVITNPIKYHCTTKAKKKKKRTPPTRDQPPTADRPGTGDAGGGGGLDGDESQTVGTLTPAERRARKSRARAAKIEEARLKKEEALRDERLAKLDHQDDFKSFNMKVGPDIEYSFLRLVVPSTSIGSVARR